MLTRVQGPCLNWFQFQAVIIHGTLGNVLLGLNFGKRGIELGPNIGQVWTRFDKIGLSCSRITHGINQIQGHLKYLINIIRNGKSYFLTKLPSTDQFGKAQLRITWCGMRTVIFSQITGSPIAFHTSGQTYQIIIELYHLLLLLSDPHRENCIYSYDIDYRNIRKTTRTFVTRNYTIITLSSRRKLVNPTSEPLNGQPFICNRNGTSVKIHHTIWRYPSLVTVQISPMDYVQKAYFLDTLLDHHYKIIGNFGTYRLHIARVRALRPIPTFPRNQKPRTTDWLTDSAIETIHNKLSSRTLTWIKRGLKYANTSGLITRQIRDISRSYYSSGSWNTNSDLCTGIR